MKEIPNTQIENPNLLAKQKAIKIIQQILNTTVDIDTIDDTEKYIANIFNVFVTQVDELVRIYKEENGETLNQNEDIRNIEDAALEKAGFKNVSNTIDKILEIKEIISVSIPNLVKTYTDNIITPPDTDKEIITGSGEGFDVKKDLIPRLKTLLFILLVDCNLKEDQIKVTVGSVDKNMIRKEPYVMVEIDGLNRLVFVCDENGNRTDVFDMTQNMCQKEGAQGLALLTKEEKNEFGRMYPGSHASIIFSPNWSDRVYNSLINPLDQKLKKEKPVKRPKTFESLPRADQNGFYVDLQGNRWGSAEMISREISIGLKNNKNFQVLLLTLNSIKILSGSVTVSAYNIEEVREAMHNHPELCAYFRRADKTGFYTDNEGINWGSVSVITKEIIPGLSYNKEFKKLLSNLNKIKMLFGAQTVDAYQREEVREAMHNHPELCAYFRIADESGFYTDEKGKRWGSIAAIAKEISTGLITNKDFPIILLSLETIKILSGSVTADAYNIEEVREAMHNHPELSAYFKRIDSTGFYTDSSGNRWGSIDAITNEISAGLRNNQDFKSLLSGLSTLTTISGCRKTQAYNIEEVREAMRNHPELSAFLNKVDKTGFYTDEEGKRWGSIAAIAKEISPGLITNKDFHKLLESLSSIKILSGKITADAYNIEEVREAMHNHPELSAYFRRTDKTVFHTDKDGNRWGSLAAIIREISPGLITNRDFHKLIETLPSVKILSGTVMADAYNIEEIKKLILLEPKLVYYHDKILNQ
jgi:hypothetical protein